MKMTCFLAMSFAAVVACADVAFKVKDVEAHQRYPWNGKVDIDFTIDSAVEGSIFTVCVEAKDTVGQTNVTLTTVRYDDKVTLSSLEKLPAGRHRVTWDADTDVPGILIPSLAFSVSVWVDGEKIPDNGLYMVIDLLRYVNVMGEMRYPITYLTAVPEGGWTDEYKTTKLVLRRIPAGEDPLGRYTLTKDFYAGIFEVTERQWNLVMGKTPSDTDVPKTVSYNDIRGRFVGAKWPTSSEVDSSSFLGLLRVRTGIEMFDLPTEAQWEYACRAGTRTEYNVGRNDEVGCQVAGWYYENSGNDEKYERMLHGVGEKTPNGWGLYDMHGNVWEWCLDWQTGTLTGVDPKGQSKVAGIGRVVRGGAFNLSAEYCTLSYSIKPYGFPTVDASDNSTGDGRGYQSNVANCGFRLFMTLP